MRKLFKTIKMVNKIILVLFPTTDVVGFVVRFNSPQFQLWITAINKINHNHFSGLQKETLPKFIIENVKEVFLNLIPNFPVGNAATSEVSTSQNLWFGSCRLIPLRTGKFVRRNTSPCQGGARGFNAT